MTNITILIRNANDDPEQTLSGLMERGINAKPLDMKECIIIEAATSGKRTGICFLMQDAMDNYYVATITADMIEYGIAAAIKGANQKWNVPPRP